MPAAARNRLKTCKLIRNAVLFEATGFMEIHFPEGGYGDCRQCRRGMQDNPVQDNTMQDDAVRDNAILTKASGMRHLEDCIK